MAYGSVKVDNIIFTNGGADETTTVSGIYKAITSGVTVSGTISGTTIQGQTISGVTVTGTTANFVSGVFTTQISGATITGDTGRFSTITGVSGVFTTLLSGTTVTGTTAQFTNITGGGIGATTITGTTVTGTTANFVSGVFTTQISGATVIAPTGTFTSLTGTTTQGTTTTFTTGSFTSLTGTTTSVTTIELGNASDTTLSRSAAGVLAVEGVVIPSISSTSTLTNKTLTDPAIIGTILEDVFTITDGAAFEVDPGNGSIQLITLGASRTPKATNFAAGESVTLMVNDGTAYTLTWTDATWGTGGVKWTGGTAPTLATSGYTVIQFWEVSTQVYGAYVGDVA